MHIIMQGGSPPTPPVPAPTAIYPGYIMASKPGARGTRRRIISDLMLHSAAAVRIKRVYCGPGGTIAVETERAYAPAFDGATTGIHARVGGWDGATGRMHRANNWNGGPLVSPPSLDPDPIDGLQLGGDPWSITPIDDRNLSLNDSIFKIEAADPDPVFIDGVLYTGLVDCWPFLKECMDFIGDDPGGALQLGQGFFALLAGPDVVTFNPPTRFLLQGAGMDQTTLFRGDYFNHTPFHFDKNRFRVADLEQMGNGAFQKSATHGWKTVAADENSSIEDYEYENVRNIDIPGYGWNNGHPGGKVRPRYKGCQNRGTRNDGKDFKGPQSTNPAGSYGGIITDDYSEHVGLGEWGTNFTRPLPLGNDPIQTFAGNRFATVLLTQQPYGGQQVTFGPLTTAVGGLVFANRSFTIVGRLGLLATIDLKTSIVSAGVGGGAGATALMPAMLKGKPGNDLRGRGWQLDNITYRGWMGRQVAVRVRGGPGTNSNGEGGHDSVLDNITTVDTSPLALGFNAARHLVVLGSNVLVGKMRATGNGAGTALVATPSATGLEIEKLLADGFATAINLQADDALIKATVRNSTLGALVDGGHVSQDGELPENPFSVEEGSGVVTAYQPAHGLAPHDDVSFDNVEVIPGIDMNDDWKVDAIVDGDRYTIDTGQTALFANAAFGGGEVAFTVSGIAHMLTRSKLEVRLRNCTTDVQVSSGRVTDVTIASSDSDAAAPTYQDPGQKVIWGPGNTGGLPNKKRYINLADGQTLALSKADAGKEIRVPSTLTVQPTVVMPLPEIGLEFPVVVDAPTGLAIVANPGAGGGLIHLVGSAANHVIRTTAVDASLTLKGRTQGWTATAVVGPWATSPS